MGGFVGRSLTPSRGKSNIPVPQNLTPPQKFRPSSASSVSGESPRTPTFEREDFLSRAKENISVTVRFRPLRYSHRKLHSKIYLHMKQRTET
jgi:centromeric protein E